MCARQASPPELQSQSNIHILFIPGKVGQQRLTLGGSISVRTRAGWSERQRRVGGDQGSKEQEAEEFSEGTKFPWEMFQGRLLGKFVQPCEYIKIH